MDFVLLATGDIHLNVALLAIVILIGAGIIREQYIKYLHSQQIEFMIDATKTLQTIPLTLSQVTQTIQNASMVDMQTKTDIIQALAAAEQRLGDSIARISKAAQIVNLPIGNVSGNGLKIGDNRE